MTPMRQIGWLFICLLRYVFYFWKKIQMAASTLGFSPEPCRRNVPVMNQKLLETLNWFSTTSDWERQGCGLFHSQGENRAMTKSVKLTRRQAARTQSQISAAKGFMNEKSLVGWLVGTWPAADRQSDPHPKTSSLFNSPFLSALVKKINHFL